MKKKTLGLIPAIVLLLIITGISGWSEGSTDPTKPVLMITVGKLNSDDFYHSQLPGIRRLLSQSSCGLLNVRSGGGFSSNSGYLTIGSGNRALVPEKSMEWANDLKWLKENEPFDDTVWDWLGKDSGQNVKIPEDVNPNGTSFIPEIGLVKNEPENINRGAVPGLLGSIMRSSGWKTYLIGDQGNKSKITIPGCFLIMDNQGIIDEVLIGQDFNEDNRFFPYFSYFNNSKAFQYITANLGPRKIVVVDFSDFSRLDSYRSEMMPERYAALKQASLRHLDQLIQSITRRWTAREINFFLLSPSISQEGVLKKNLLAPIVIRAEEYPKGLVVSGTTKWPGLVANIDILPTVLHMSGLKVPQGLPGRLIRTEKAPEALRVIEKLSQSSNQSTANSRSLIDWYLGIISFGWIAFLFLYGLKWIKLSDWVLTGVAVAPFSLLIMPWFPTGLWNVGGFLIMTVLLALPLVFVKNQRLRFFILSAVFWFLLIGDQATGWYLGRFSALGYGSTGGARYYGMGNEYMGIFLALSVFVADWLARFYNREWPAIIVFGLAVFILGWPQLGINFGGTLAALFGFGFYLCVLMNVRFKNRKFWMGLITIGLLIVALAWWDSSRNPEVQTHLGRFFKNVFQKEWTQVFQVISRKLAMNLKLIVSSPWTRIIILSLLAGVVHRLFFKNRIIGPKDYRAWLGVLASAFAALIFNDSGVIAMATCLAYAWTVFLALSLDTDSSLEKHPDL